MSELARFLRVWLSVAALLVPLSSCGGEPQKVSISATTFNYSADYLIDVWVNGKSAASLIKPAKSGQIKGGGGFLCCVVMSPAWKTVKVDVHLSTDEEYSVDAPILQPWPEVASYLVVHVLPGRKVVVEIVPGAAIPDPSRLDELIKFARSASK